MSNNEIDLVRRNTILLRTARGITQQQLANLVDVNQAQISRIENGSSADLSLSMVLKICRALEITPEDMLDTVAFAKHLAATLAERDGVAVPEALHSGASGSVPESREVSSAPNPATHSEPDAESSRVNDLRSIADRLDRHMVVVGKTGDGKTEFMRWLVRQISWQSTAIVHFGPFTHEALNNMIVEAPERTDDIVFLDFTDASTQVPFNVLDVTDAAAVGSTVTVIEGLFRSLGVAPKAGPALGELVRCLCRINLEFNQDPDATRRATLMDIGSFFEDNEFAKSMIRVFPGLRAHHENSNKQNDSLIDLMAQIRNNDLLGRVFAAERTRIDWEQLIQEQAILILNTYEPDSDWPAVHRTLSSLMFHQIAQGAGRSEQSRCRIVVDEAPTVLDRHSQIPEVLAEARRWDLGLVMLGEDMDQFDPDVAEAIRRNTGIVVASQTDPDQVRSAAELMRSAGLVDDLQKLGPHDLMIRLPDMSVFTAWFPGSPKRLDFRQQEIRRQVIERSRALLEPRVPEYESLRVGKLTERLQTIEPDEVWTEIISDKPKGASTEKSSDRIPKPIRAEVDRIFAGLGRVRWNRYQEALGDMFPDQVNEEVLDQVFVYLASQGRISDVREIADPDQWPDPIWPEED